jgi:hypothetical protein
MLELGSRKRFYPRVSLSRHPGRKWREDVNLHTERRKGIRSENTGTKENQLLFLRSKTSGQVNVN